MLCPRAAVRTFIVGAAGIAAAVLAYLQRLPGVAGGGARGLRGVKRMCEPGGLAAWVVHVEGDATQTPFSVEGAGVLATFAVVVPVDGVDERIPGELAAGVRYLFPGDLSRTPQSAVGFLDDVEHHLEPVALRDRPLAVDVARHAAPPCRGMLSWNVRASPSGYSRIHRLVGEAITAWCWYALDTPISRASLSVTLCALAPSSPVSVP
jgi:hypothetical protein